MRNGWRGIFRLNNDGSGLDLRLDPGRSGLLFGSRFDPSRIDGRNITTCTEIGERQPQAGKFQRGTAAMRRRTDRNRRGRFFGNGNLHLIGEIESLRLRRMGVSAGRNIAGNIGREFRHGMPFRLRRLDDLRLFPRVLGLGVLGGSLLVNNRLGSARLARMHIKNFRHRTGVITEIGANILLPGCFDVIVDIGLIDLGKRLLPHLRLRRGFIHRRKLGLATGENLLDALHEIVGMDAGTNIVCRVKNDRIGVRRIVNLELTKQLVFEIEFGFAADDRRCSAWLDRGTRMRRTIFEADDTRQFCQRIVVSEPFGPGVPVIRDIFFDHYVFHHLRIAALASVL